MYIKFLNDFKENVYGKGFLVKFFVEYEIIILIITTILFSIPLLYYTFNYPNEIIKGFAIFLLLAFLFIGIVRYIFRNKKSFKEELIKLIYQYEFDNKESLKWLLNESEIEIKKITEKNNIDFFKYFSIGISLISMLFNFIDKQIIPVNLLYSGVILILISIFAIPLFIKLINYESKDIYEYLVSSLRYYIYNCKFEEDGKICKKQSICKEFTSE